MTKEARFCWNELETRDMESASKFYQDVFGWTACVRNPDDPDHYVLFKSGETVIAGMLDINDPQFASIPNHWFSYVRVEDIVATCAKVEAAGGQIHKPPFTIPTVGKIAVISDSTNAVFGLVEPESRT